MNGLKKEAFVFDYDKIVVERPFDFSLHSSIACGGLAKTAFYPQSEGELTALLSRLDKDEKRWIILGNLTNVLPPDLGTEKVVISTKKLKKIDAQSNVVYVEAGVSSGALLRALRQEGLSGAEFLTGIPCSMGGALFMNAGVNGRYINEITLSVRVYRKGEIITLPVEECRYAYKTSIFMENDDVILGATFLLEKRDRALVVEKEKEYRARRNRLPKERSMGCVFKNLPNVSAGELIEKAGLKGLRIGGAKVSEIHANFIINDGKATAKEVLTLI